MAQVRSRPTAAALRPDQLTDPWQMLHLVSDSLDAVDSGLPAAQTRAEEAEEQHEDAQARGTYRERRRAASQRREAHSLLRVAERTRALLREKQAELTSGLASDQAARDENGTDSEAAPWAHVLDRLTRLVEYRRTLSTELERSAHPTRRSGITGELRNLEREIAAAHRACAGSPAALRQALQVDPSGARQAEAMAHVAMGD